MLKQSEKILLAFLYALTTFGVLFLLYNLMVYLYGILGLMAIFGLIGFAITWFVWYLLFNK